MKAEPIMGRPFAWWVESESEPGKRHLVDWLGCPPSCSCNAYAMNNRKHTLGHGTHYTCKHMVIAKDQCWAELLDGVREQLLSR